ncbi:hypothetical protein DFP72DRAFT_1075673 [Ephemerocybe angulata]|uniref:Uncharacterized protein n=1 Tax=Ephemerocybe angulata TaxID=980116 RepID=A0A8H6HJT8_9AGAR|nr:hypothetical protein DFP72DRAFT_1075673 [Tulosesus angulatus]
MYDNFQHPTLVEQHNAQPWATSAPVSTFASQRQRCASRQPTFKPAQVKNLSDPTPSPAAILATCTTRLKKQGSPGQQGAHSWPESCASSRSLMKPSTDAPIHVKYQAATDLLTVNRNQRHSGNSTTTSSEPASLKFPSLLSNGFGPSALVDHLFGATIASPAQYDRPPCTRPTIITTPRHRTGATAQATAEKSRAGSGCPNRYLERGLSSNGRLLYEATRHSYNMTVGKS